MTVAGPPIGAVTGEAAVRVPRLGPSDASHDPPGASRAGSAEVAHRVAEELLEVLVRERFSGWDPYDALASPGLHALARGPLARRAAIQALKRAPVNPRPLLGVPPMAHTKGLALCASATTVLARHSRSAVHRQLALDLARRVAAKRIVTGHRVGWGYDFDVQTRWGFYPREEPNAIVTAFAADALSHVAEEHVTPEFDELLDGVVRFAMDDLLTATPGGDRFFAYHRGSKTPIHNASLRIAGVVARRAAAGSDAWEAAETAVGAALSRQRPDGSWAYGESRRLGWVDGYHTAYVLESLHRWAAQPTTLPILSALRRGLDFYLRHLFDADGAPRATTTRRWPIDVHAASSAVWVLAQLAPLHERALPTAGSTLDWTLTNLRRPDGRFGFQVHRRHRKMTPYVRWSDAHMLLALATYAAERHG